MAIFLLVPIAYAAEQFYAEAIPINEKIYEDEAASFYLKIINNLGNTDTYRIYTLDFPLWSIYSAPGEYSVSATVGPKNTKTEIIFLEPVTAKPGIHAVNINVRSMSTDKVITVPATVSLRHPAGSKQYVPTVIMDIDITKDINPREPVAMKLYLSNQNPLDMPNLTVMIESDSGLIQKLVTPGIKPKERKTVEIAVELDSKTPPQPDVVYFSLIRGNETITGPIKKNIEIIEVVHIEATATPTKTLMKTDSNVVFTNDGNKKYEGKVKVETTFLKSMFTSADPPARTIREEGIRYVSWDVSMEPGDTFEVRVVTNYRPLILIIALMIIAGLLYYKFRSPLIIKKSVVNIQKGEGGITGVKVILNITNRGKSSVKEVDLSDKIPDLVELEKEVTIGSLQPDKILKHEKKGMLLKWHIEELEPDEERVITYRVKAKLSILGEFMLPPMLAKFRFEGRNVKSHSNRLYINS
jgi:hypothetical protein